jgi:hypothetical protein
VEPVVHEKYVVEPPRPENLVDLFAGLWVSALPGHPSGEVGLFDDRRMRWAIEQAGGMKGKRVLELGPLEGGHTYMLHNSGAREVTSVEANTACYLKCLVVQQLYSMERVKFELGNFIPWLDSATGPYDFVAAAGVLYHTVDPVAVLENLCRLGPEVYVWTHYADLTAMPEKDPRYVAGIVAVEEASHQGIDYKLFRRQYLTDTTTDPKFCGGVHKAPAWLEKDTILAFFDKFGFDVDIEHEEPFHPNGPSASFFARRRNLKTRVARIARRGAPKAR